MSVHIIGPTYYPTELVTWSKLMVIYGDGSFTWDRYTTGIGAVDQHGEPVEQVAGSAPYLAGDDTSWVAPLQFNTPALGAPQVEESSWGLAARLPPMDLTAWTGGQVIVRSRNVGPHPGAAAGFTSYFASVVRWDPFITIHDLAGSITFDISALPTDWTDAGTYIGVFDTAGPFWISRDDAAAGNLGVIIFPTDILGGPYPPAWPLQISSISFTPDRYDDVTPPLRWVQRSDGLGAGAPRTKQRSTIQSSNRSRGIV